MYRSIGHFVKKKMKVNEILSYSVLRLNSKLSLMPLDFKEICWIANRLIHSLIYLIVTNLKVHNKHIEV